jgi:hypothetical protein
VPRNVVLPASRKSARTKIKKRSSSAAPGKKKKASSL